MSRPYPVGEKVAGHKLASLYIIILLYNNNLLAVQKPTSSSVLGSWGQLAMHVPFGMDCLKIHEEE